jgi:hypothetical protein
MLYKLFLPQLTNLERMVVSRAIGSSFLSHLSAELSLERTLLEISNFHSQNLWMFSVIAVVLYGQYKYNQGQDKFETIAVYDKYKVIVREVLLVLFLVFTRDVQNAI